MVRSTHSGLAACCFALVSSATFVACSPDASVDSTDTDGDAWRRHPRDAGGNVQSDGGTASSDSGDASSPSDGGAYTDTTPATDASRDAADLDGAAASPPTDCSTTRCVYVRAGASGQGADWSNALPDLPATLERGTTYFLADGVYAPHTFSTPTAGTTRITLKKATASDHGADLGWSNGYGTGQATFSGADGVWVFTTGYYDIDGATEYGIKVASTSSTENTSTVAIPYNMDASYLSFKHVEFQGEATGTRVFWSNAPTSHDVYFGHDYFHGGRVWLALASSHVTAEYNHLQDAISNDSNLHGAGVVVIGQDVTLRYNTFENAIGAMTTYIEPQFDTSGIYVYGNVFEATSSSEGTSQGILAITSTDRVTDVKVYNNTIYGLHGSSPGVWCGNVSGSNCAVQNNIWQNTSSVNCTNCASFDHNALPTDSISFTNTSLGDFRLLAPTAAGVTLIAPFNIDPAGAVRGADGAWDTGAFEFAQAP